LSAAATEQTASARYSAVETLADRILGRLQEEVTRLGFDPSEVPLRPSVEADYHLERDPANGEYSLVGEWRDAKGMQLGNLLFHADGSFFVEHDIARIHPREQRWFVEAVNAWGKDERIKAEARLLPMPE